MKTLYDYEQVKHESCSSYSTLTLSAAERKIAGITEEVDFETIKKYRDELKNYLYLSQIGLRKEKSRHFGKSLRIDHMEAIEEEIAILNTFLT